MASRARQQTNVCQLCSPHSSLCAQVSFQSSGKATWGCFHPSVELQKLIPGSRIPSFYHQYTQERAYQMEVLTQLTCFSVPTFFFSVFFQVRARILAQESGKDSQLRHHPPRGEGVEKPSLLSGQHLPGNSKATLGDNILLDWSWPDTGNHIPK